MPYTLMKGLGWFLIALVLGIVIGWLLRSVVAKRQVAPACWSVMSALPTTGLPSVK